MKRWAVNVLLAGCSLILVIIIAAGLISILAGLSDGNLWAVLGGIAWIVLWLGTLAYWSGE